MLTTICGLLLVFIFIWLFIPASKGAEQTLLAETVKVESLVDNLRVVELEVEHAIVGKNEICEPSKLAHAYLHGAGCTGNCGHSCGGSDVSSQIQIKELSGGKLKLQHGKWMLDTSHTGSELIEFIIAPKGGRIAKKQIVIIIDDRG